MLSSWRTRVMLVILYSLLLTIVGRSVAGSGETAIASSSVTDIRSGEMGVYAAADTPLETSSLGLAVMDGESCTDSDGGINPELQGTVTGVGPNGYPYSRTDACETGQYEGYLREFFCSGNLFRAQRAFCPEGCFEGACGTTPPVCTDEDEDGFASEGGSCGLVDCDDTNPSINPGVAEVCGNGIDDNCDGLTDSEDPICVVCTDNDGDGFAVEGSTCGPIDCDDSNPDVNPGATEACSNGVDDNCNGLLDSSDPVCRETKNVIVVGWDGVNRDHFWQCYNREVADCPNGLPNIQALSNGAIFNNTTTSGDSATKPGWAQIFSGYDAEVTGVFSNGEYQPIPVDFTIFEKIQNHLGAENVVTMFISGKDVNTGDACVGEVTTKAGQIVIEDQGQPWCLVSDQLDYYENDLRQNSVVANRAMDLLEVHQNDLFIAAFIFRTPDVIGHLAGVDSSQYFQALKDNDYWLGQVTNTLNQLGLSDSTLVYVTTDHGFDAASNRHGNAPYGFFASNDIAIVRSGDRRDIAPTILELFGITLGQIGNTPAVDGFSLYSIPPLSCIPEGESFIDYTGAPACCSGLTLVNLDEPLGAGCFPATGTTGDNSGYCTACGNGVCEAPENRCNCAADCS